MVAPEPARGGGEGRREEEVEGAGEGLDGGGLRGIEREDLGTVLADAAGALEPGGALLEEGRGRGDWSMSESELRREGSARVGRGFEGGNALVLKRCNRTLLLLGVGHRSEGLRLERVSQGFALAAGEVANRWTPLISLSALVGRLVLRARAGRLAWGGGG